MPTKHQEKDHSKAAASDQTTNIWRTSCVCTKSKLYKSGEGGEEAIETEVTTSEAKNDLNGSFLSSVTAKGLGLKADSNINAIIVALLDFNAKATEVSKKITKMSPSAERYEYTFFYLFSFLSLHL